MASYGKQMLKASLEKQELIKRRKTKSRSPEADAQFWVNAGLDQEGMEIRFISDFKGFGVIATKRFEKGSFLLQYTGELLSYKEGLSRETQYIKEGIDRWFLYLFKYNSKKMWIDATKTSFGRIGRVVNDGVGEEMNCKMKLTVLQGQPVLCLYASRIINPGEELLYDYGDNAGHLWWRKKDKSHTTGCESTCGHHADRYYGDEEDDDPFDLGKASDEESELEQEEVMEVQEEAEPSTKSRARVEEKAKEQTTADTATEATSQDVHIETGDVEQVQVDSGKEAAGDDVTKATEEKMETSAAAEKAIEDSGEVGKDPAEKRDKSEEAVEDKRITEDGSTSMEIREKEMKHKKLYETVEKSTPTNAEATKEFTADISAKVDATKECSAEDASKSDDMSDKAAEETGKVDTAKSKGESYMLCPKTGLFVPPEVTRKRKQYGLKLKRVRLDEESDIDIDDDSGSEYLPSDESDYASDTSYEYPQTAKTVIQLPESFQGTSSPITDQSCSPLHLDQEPLEEISISEQSCSQDKKKMNEVLVQQKEHGNGKKGLDKKHCCLFCEKIMAKMPRHLKKKHANEIPVARVLAYPKKKDQVLGLSSLMYEGDYQHNYDCLQSGSGMIIPRYCGRKGKRLLKAKDLVPCEYCKALFVSEELYRHKCSMKSLKDASLKKSPGVKAARLMLPLPSYHQNHAELYKTVIVNMKDDDVKLVVESDSLIKEFGSRQLENTDSEVSNVQNISTKLRELGRLLIEVKGIDTAITSLKESLLPKNWPLLLNAVKNVAGYDSSTRKYKIPSLALKLGYSLKHCAKIARCQSIIERDRSSTNSYSDFLELYDAEYYTRISARARNTLYIDRYNRPLLLPLAEDVTKMHKHLQKELDQLMELPCPGYQDFVEALLAQVILFNRKRAGEAQRMKIEDYQNAVKNAKKAPDQTVLKCLTKFEAHLCASHLRVEIRGKKGRKVPVLLTERMQKGIELLLKFRERPDVNPTAKYVFARPGNAKTPYFGNVAIRKHAILCHTKQPELLTSTGLRKQLGTICQILALSETHQDILAGFMGHDIRVHRQFYRLPENFLEVAKVSKVLHAINEGRIAEFQGKDLEEINVGDNETVEFEDDDDDDAEDMEEEKVEDQQPLNKAEQKSPKAGDKKLRRKMNLKRQYTVEQKKCMSETFRQFIKLGKAPGRRAVEDAQRVHACLQSIPWRLIYYCIRNTVLKRSNLTMKT